MFVIGKASPEEIQEMERMGYAVEPVNTEAFDRAVDPNWGHVANPPEQYVKEETEDKLVSIYFDYDIVQEVRNTHAIDKSAQNLA